MGATDPMGEGGRYPAPSASEIAKIPELVRKHRITMGELDAATRAARKRWTEMRQRWMEGKVPQPLDVATVTADLWHAEKKQALAAALYRVMLDENNARPTGQRWSPTALEAWARSVRGPATSA